MISDQKLFFRVVLFKPGTFLLACLMVLGVGCSKKKAPEFPPLPVETAVAVQKDVPRYLETFGTLTALADVDIKSQVTGKILEVHFKEGQKVQEGDLLFSIDSSEYKADVDKMKAALKVDQVDLKLKQDTLERNRPLVAKDLVSQQEFEKLQTEVETDEAQIALDQASLELAKINLGYCSIKSPVTGIIGKRLVDAGNIVQENTGPTLANVKSMDELYVDFTVSDRDLAEIRKAMAAETLKVELHVPDDKTVYSGELKLIENSINNTTGTIFLRAIVPNKDAALWPGQFIYVRLILGTEKNAVLVPYQATQLGQKGAFAFVVTADKTADLRPLTLGSRQGDDIVIEKGIKAGETVVTSGQISLSPGVPVVEVPAQQTGSPATAAAASTSPKKAGAKNK